MNKESEIYIICDYRYIKGTLLKQNKKTNKVRFQYSPSHIYEESYISKEKCAFPDEEILFIWELWKGRNGRGGYRIEKFLYPELRVRADIISLGTFSSDKIGHYKETSNQ